MQKRVDIDPWSVLPTEEITVGGIQVQVRGLSIRELTDATKACKGDDAAVARALVCACISRADGKEVTPEAVATYRPDIFKALSDAVARVNGFNEGNSNATGADASSIA